MYRPVRGQYLFDQLEVHAVSLHAQHLFWEQQLQQQYKVTKLKIAKN
jgi:hypothetical protein